MYRNLLYFCIRTGLAEKYGRLDSMRTALNVLEWVLVSPESERQDKEIDNLRQAFCSETGLDSNSLE